MELNHLPVQIRTIIRTAPNVRMEIPQVVGMANRKIQSSINRAIHQSVQNMVREQGYLNEPELFEMIGGYEIKTNERGILSLTLSNYAYRQHSAHGLTLMRSLSVDVDTGKFYRLSDLFKADSDYVQVISAMVEEQIKAREIPTLGEFGGIQPNQSYYLADKCLVIYFAIYEITPYVVQFPMFPISVYAVQSMASEEGPLGILAAS